MGEKRACHLPNYLLAGVKKVHLHGADRQKKKPELANWQKVMDNGEYLRSAEMAEEANYNMIDGLMNNTPKKKDKNAPRRSVLKRLRKHQQKIASQGKGQPQQQRAVEEEMERKKK